MDRKGDAVERGVYSTALGSKLIGGKGVERGGVAKFLVKRPKSLERSFDLFGASLIFINIY